MTIRMKRGDTAPPLTLTLSSSSGAVDLDEADTVRVLIYRDATRALVVDAAPTITGADTVRYDWQAGDTAAAGSYRIEVEVTWLSGAVQTFPSDSWGRLEIVEDLG